MDVKKEGRQCQLVLTENIVAGVVEELKKTIREQINAGCLDITLDFKNIESIDSSGLGVLIATQNELKQKQGGLSVSNVSDSIMKMFKIMRLDKHFAVHGA
jgi:anti-anti-sigma factor